jgi:YTH domain-containing family protein
VQQQGAASPSPVHMSPTIPQGGQGQNTNPGQTGQQHPFAMSNPNALAFAAQQMGMSGMGMGIGMNPMLQMQMNMNTPFSNPAAMQSVMRNPSPGPLPIGSPFMGGQF